MKQERFQQELQQVAQEGALTPTPGVAAFGAPRGDPQAGAGVPPDEHAVSPAVWASVQEKRQIAGTLKQLHTLQSGIVDPGDRAALAGLITKYQDKARGTQQPQEAVRQAMHELAAARCKLKTTQKVLEEAQRGMMVATEQE